MRPLLRAIRIALIDMSRDLRRFVLLIACLAVGTALIAGVGSVGASIRQAVERDAALIMGGDVELQRADRPANAEELALISGYGQLTNTIDTNVRAEFGEGEAFVDLISAGPGYPLLGEAYSPQMPRGDKPYDYLAYRPGGTFGALVDPLMLDQLGANVGDIVTIGGTPFEIRGTLGGLPDGPVRGFRLGTPALISTDGFANLSDQSSPLPGLGTFYRYKVVLSDRNAEGGKAALITALNDPAWTIRTARDGLGPMVSYYDLFMRFLVIVGLASLLIGGVSVWSGISAYVGERASVIAILRSLGGNGRRVFTHFFTQVMALAAIGVLIGLVVGGGAALIAVPIVGQAVGIALPAVVHIEPLLVSAGVGFVTAFGFSYAPLQAALEISPVTLFRAKGLSTPSTDWARLLGSHKVLPLLVAALLFCWLAVVMTDDSWLVGGFVLASALAVVIFRVVLWLVLTAIRRMPPPSNRTLRYALRDIAAHGGHAPAVVVSIGLALAILVVVLVLQLNLRNEYLGASVFDAPTLVANDLFQDEVDAIEAMRAEGGDITAFTATPMLRGSVTAVNGTPVASLQASGPEASFLLSGDVPMTYRPLLPASSRVVAGEWWAADYGGPPLISLHQSLRAGLGIDLGNTLTFSIFGDEITATVASFRDYSWQGGIDFLATFSPGVLEGYPTTLLAAVTARRGAEDDVERALAIALPDVKFIPIGQTLELITSALGQLSLAASLVGGLAVGNGLLVLLGSLATGRRQRQANAVINRVLGARRGQVLAVAVLHYGLLAAFAVLIATPVGILLAMMLSDVLLDVEFAIDPVVILLVELGAIAIAGALGAATIIKGLRGRAALFLRELATE